MTEPAGDIGSRVAYTVGMRTLPSVSLLIRIVACLQPAFAGAAATAVADTRAEAFLDLRKFDVSIRQAAAPGHPSRCVLRRETASALARAQAAMKISELGLKVVGCYVPGTGTHATGAAVDVVPVDASGNETGYPTTAVDEKPGFVPKTLKRRQSRHTERLRRVLEREGFRADPRRPWHFELSAGGPFPENDFPIEAVPDR